MISLVFDNLVDMKWQILNGNGYKFHEIIKTRERNYYFYLQVFLFYFIWYSTSTE